MTALVRRICALSLVFAFAASMLPARALAADIEVSGWIPYWKVSEGTRDARKHLSTLDALHPFSYSLKSDGSLNDLAGMKKSNWTRLVKDAQKKDVLVLPTITTSNTALVFELLSNSEKREDHI